MEPPAHSQKLAIPPAVAHACGTKRIAARFRAAYPDPGGLGRAIHMLALGQEKTAELIKSLGSEYDNKYLWKLIATAEQRQKLSSVLSYSAFSWEASLKEAIHQASSRPGFVEEEIESYLGPRLATSAAYNRSLTAEPSLISGLPSSLNCDLNTRSASDRTPNPGLTFASPKDYGSAGAAAVTPPPDTSGTPLVHGSHAFNSPDHGTNTSSTVSLFSRNGLSHSTPTITPPNSADKPDPIPDASPCHAATSIGTTSHRLVNQEPTRTSTPPSKVNHRVAKPGGHLGDGISQLHPLFSGRAFPSMPLDATGNLPVYNPGRLPHHEAPAQGANGALLILEPSGVVMSVSGAQPAYSPVVSHSHPATHASAPKKKANPFPYPRSKYQPWAGMVCYDVPITGSPHQLFPLYATSQTGKRKLLMHKLARLSLEDEQRLLIGSLARVAKKPVHIFIDLSNIMIGFYDRMKMLRGIPTTKRVKAPEFSFDNFHALLARDRKVEKKIVVGSLGLASMPPKHMVEADELGYEMNILQRVNRVAMPQFRRKERSHGIGGSDGPSGADTSGDDGYTNLPKLAEQGVDELLHFKILESIVDSNNNTATIVLATGDGAQAQFSGGFKEQMERALEKGWHVELYSWSHNLSSVWKSSAFTEKWGPRFRYISLDDYAEELHLWWLKPQA